jgi:hypothetical protein
MQKYCRLRVLHRLSTGLRRKCMGFLTLLKKLQYEKVQNTKNSG